MIDPIENLGQMIETARINGYVEYPFFDDIDQRQKFSVEWNCGVPFLHRSHGKFTEELTTSQAIEILERFF